MEPTQLISFYLSLAGVGVRGTASLADSFLLNVGTGTFETVTLPSKVVEACSYFGLTSFVLRKAIFRTIAEVASEAGRPPLTFPLHFLR